MTIEEIEKPIEQMGVKKSFFFHYNKPASKNSGYPIISLHFKHKCTLVTNIVCNVPTKGKIRNGQPHFVMWGRANQIEIKDGIGVIT